MKPFRWSQDKNRLLIRHRGISFERIVVAVAGDGLLDEFVHPNEERYPNQRVMVVECDAYVYLVPYIEDESHLFLKTAIPSRKATRDYLNSTRRGESHE